MRCSANLLVFYFRHRGERDAVVARLARMGHPAVPPENPYWLGKSITVEDPDGWRVVLFDGTWKPDSHQPAAGHARAR